MHLSRVDPTAVDLPEVRTMLADYAATADEDETEAELETGALSHIHAVAYNALLSLAYAQANQTGRVSDELLELMEQPLTDPSRHAAEERFLLAVNFAGLHQIAPVWAVEHTRSVLFRGPDHEDTTVFDRLLDRAPPTPAVLRSVVTETFEASQRGIEGADSWLARAMLDGLPGAEPTSVAQHNARRHRSAAGIQTVARSLFNAPTLPAEVLARLLEFLTAATTAAAAEPLTGAGWLAYADGLPTTNLANILIRALPSLGRSGPGFEAMSRILERLESCAADEQTLVLLDGLVRRSHEPWEQNEINEAAYRIVLRCEPLAATPEYERLLTALQERGYASPDSSETA